MKLHLLKNKLMNALLLVVFVSCQVLAQGITVKGKITSQTDGGTLPGVSVSLKGTSRGTTTDPNGNFTLNNADAKGTLVISYSGYTTQEVAIGNRSTINLSLVEDAKALSEVVVTGYGTQRKSQVTGAISQVSAKQITEMPITSLGQALQGRTAGLDVSQSG